MRRGETIPFRKTGKTWVLSPLLLFFVLFAPSSGISSAQHQPKLYLGVDYAHFRGDSSRAFVEIYYSFGVGQLKFFEEGGKFKSAVRLNVQVLELGGAVPVYDRAWEVPYSTTDTSLGGRGKSMVGVLGLWLQPAQYTLRVTGRDVNNEDNRDSLDLPLRLRPLGFDSLALSDVELCTSIKQIEPDSSNIFYKNTLEVIPNPSVLYGAGLPIIYYYVEAYNLLERASGGEYVYTASVLDAAGNEVIKQSRAKKRIHNSSVEVGTINIGKLKSGTYSFRYLIEDSVTQQQAAVAKKFFVYNPQESASPVQTGGGMGGDFLASEYSLMTEQDLKREFDYVRYIAQNDELDRFAKLADLDGKRRFMFEFWKRRDPDPSTRLNELKREYVARVEYSNINFRAAGKEGWRTDRGRVYIMYGPPDEFERHPNEIDSKPYEVWYYHNLQGGVEFVFIEKASFGDYILVHSTHRSEIRDDNWRAQLINQ
jgi:GWxTD domain-containing protein